MSKTSSEIASQPDVWAKAAEVAKKTGPLASDEDSLAVIGCGTSWFIAQAYTRMREVGGEGISDAFTATEFPMDREYDRVVCLSRSGTTSEIIDVMKVLYEAGRPAVLVTAVAGGPAAPYADFEVVLDFADEESVVQTRFATSALAYFRATLGDDVDKAVEDAKKALEVEIPQSWIDATQITFLGTGWTIGLANEAGLKLREASQSWTETYPAMEYRHGPISIAEPGRLVWIFGEAPNGLIDQIDATGAEVHTSELDPMADLVVAQRLAVARAEAKGLNPDKPRHLTRSVILDEE
ncbi:MAG: SIS domain-containing protein [Actinomycetaceae bacterium]|nr:SIS domain-containing protein [Actinomycetaceae bacterium]